MARAAQKPKRGKGKGKSKGQTRRQHKRQSCAAPPPPPQTTEASLLSSSLLQSIVASGSASSGGGVANMFAARAAAAQSASLLTSSRNDCKSFEQLTPQQIDDLWERFNAPEAHDDDEFEIWPDLAVAKQQKRRAACVATQAAASTATVETTSATAPLDIATAPAVLVADDDDDDDDDKCPCEPKSHSGAQEGKAADCCNDDNRDDKDDNDGHTGVARKRHSESEFACIADYDSSEDDDQLEDVLYPQTPMPAVGERSMDEVLGVPTGDGDGPSLLSRILNPDSGGKGKNKTGLHGLIAQDKNELTPREKAQQRLRALRRQRQGLSADQRVYDKRGRVVRGARQVTMEDVQAGVVPRSQLQNVDREATREQIRQNIEKMRAGIAAEKQQKQNAQSAAVAAAVDGNVVPADGDAQAMCVVGPVVL